MQRRRKTEKEKEENIWRRKIIFLWRGRKTEANDRWTDIEGSARGPGRPKNSDKKEENIWRRKIILFGGEEKRRRKRREILGKENIFLWRRRKTEK